MRAESLTGRSHFSRIPFLLPPPAMNSGGLPLLRIPNRSFVCIFWAAICEKLRAWRPRGASVSEVRVEALAFRARSPSLLSASIRTSPSPNQARSFLPIFAGARCARHVLCPQEPFFACKACLLKTRSTLASSTAFRSASMSTSGFWASPSTNQETSGESKRCRKTGMKTMGAIRIC